MGIQILTIVNRADIRIEHVHDGDGRCVEGAIFIAPAHQHLIAFFKFGRFSHALADDSGNIGGAVVKLGSG